MPLLAVCPAVRFKEFYPGTGNPLSGGYVYTVQVGTSAVYGSPPAYPMTTYADALGVMPNANPIILDSNGEAPIFITGPLRLVVFDQNGNALPSQDNISAAPAITSTYNHSDIPVPDPVYRSRQSHGQLRARYEGAGIRHGREHIRDHYRVDTGRHTDHHDRNGRVGLDHPE